MLKIKTTIGPSKIHGTGLFAAEPIPSGTLIWEFTPGFDRAMTDLEMRQLPLDARRYLADYAYRSQTSGRHIIPEDNGRYFNHSDTPNTISRYNGNGEAQTYALRDIAAGEELTDNYDSFAAERYDDDILAETQLDAVA